MTARRKQGAQLIARVRVLLEEAERTELLDSIEEELLERLRVWAATGEERDAVLPEEIGALLRRLGEARA